MIEIKHDTLSLNDIEEFILTEKTNRQLLLNKKDEIVKEKETNNEWLKGANNSREIVNALAQKTLEQISTQIGQLVTDAIQSVFENPYTFDISFVNRRNQTECDLYVVRNGRKRHPLESNGGGLADVISVPFRCTFLVLSELHPVLILDEPYKFLSVDLQNYCFMMLKTISDQLGIQIIVVSHLNEMKEIADNIVNVTQIQGISTIKKVK